MPAESQKSAGRAHAARGKNVNVTAGLAITPVLMNGALHVYMEENQVVHLRNYLSDSRRITTNHRVYSFGRVPAGVQIHIKAAHPIDLSAAMECKRLGGEQNLRCEAESTHFGV